MNKHHVSLSRGPGNQTDGNSGQKGIDTHLHQRNPMYDTSNDTSNDTSEEEDKTASLLIDTLHDLGYVGYNHAFPTSNGKNLSKYSSSSSSSSGSSGSSNQHHTNLLVSTARPSSPSITMRDATIRVPNF